jgi:hypothetical protein
VLEIDDLVGVVFSGCLPWSSRVWKRRTISFGSWPVLGTSRCRARCAGPMTGRVHGFCSWPVTDVPVDGRRVVISLQVRRLFCPARGYSRQTFRKQVPGLLERYQRPTSRLTGQLGAVVKELAGRAGARLSAVLAVAVSRSTALRLLMRLPLSRLPIPASAGCR